MVVMRSGLGRLCVEVFLHHTWLLQEQLRCLQSKPFPAVALQSADLTCPVHGEVLVVERMC